MLMVASTESLRQQNRALVLSALRQRGPLAHTAISDWTGMSSATVSAITNELVEEGILKKAEQEKQSGRGRPRVLFIQNPDTAFAAIIRITSEFVECSLADYAGTLKDRFREPRPPEETDAKTFSKRLQAMLERMLERSNLSREMVATISITSKGVVADGKPELLWSPIFNDQHLDFKTLLAPRWSSRIHLANETEFAAKAISDRNNETSTDQVWSTDTDMVPHQSAMLSLGHSIGLGIAQRGIDGRTRTLAPLFGHMPHQGDGPLCRCGLRGCIEAYAGFYGILRTAFEVPDDTIPAKFVPVAQIDKIADNARHGDRRAEFAFRQAGEVLGIGLSRLVSLMGPMKISITGQGIRYYDLLKTGLERPLLQTLQARFGKLPPITLEQDEDELVFRGNLAACLSDMDKNIMASGSHSGAAAQPERSKET